MRIAGALLLGIASAILVAWVLFTPRGYEVAGKSVVKSVHVMIAPYIIAKADQEYLVELGEAFSAGKCRNVKIDLEKFNRAVKERDLQLDTIRWNFMDSVVRQSWKNIEGSNSSSYCFELYTRYPSLVVVR